MKQFHAVSNFAKHVNKISLLSFVCKEIAPAPRFPPSHGSPVFSLRPRVFHLTPFLAPPWTQYPGTPAPCFPPSRGEFVYDKAGYRSAGKCNCQLTVFVLPALNTVRKLHFYKLAFLFQHDLQIWKFLAGSLKALASTESGAVTQRANKS